MNELHIHTEHVYMCTSVKYDFLSILKNLFMLQNLFFMCLSSVYCKNKNIIDE